jgi:rhodanese-related sulfurtransferase
MKIFIILILAAGFAAASCSTEKKAVDPPKAETETASAIIQIVPQEAETVVTDTKIQFVDVRTKEEYAAGHAKNAVNMPLDNFKESLAKLNSSEPVYVICQTGRRSQKAAEILEHSGFKKVYNISGGTSAWSENKLPMEH